MRLSGKGVGFSRGRTEPTVGLLGIRGADIQANIRMFAFIFSMRIPIHYIKKCIIYSNFYYYIMKFFSKHVRKFQFLLLLLIVLLCFVLMIAVFSNQSANSLPDLVIEKVEIRNVEQIVYVDGTVAAVDERDVFYPMQSRVIKINVSEGDKVSKDDVLAEVEVASAIGTSTTEILSPIQGVVAFSNNKVGDQIFTSIDPGFKIIDNSEYIIEVEVNENDVVSLKVDQEARILYPAISLDEEFTGKVTAISIAAIEGVGAVNYKVTIVPEKLPKEIRIDMSASIEITAQRVPDVLSIPESFLIEKDDGFIVKVIEFTNEEKTEYEIKECDVEVGLITDEFVEIVSGLSEGTELIEPSFIKKRAFGFF